MTYSMSPLIKHSQNDKDTEVENQLKVRQPAVRNGGRRGATTKRSHHRDLVMMDSVCLLM